MLTREETGWSLKAFKGYSTLNILPLEVDVKNGKIQKQSSKIKVFIWKILFGVGVFHWLYIFGRLIQSTMIEPEKYFRWDHFVLHLGFTAANAVFLFTGFRLFVKSPEENVIIFNNLFTEREDPVQKMVDQQQPKQLKSGYENRNENKVLVISGSGKNTREKSGARIFSTSTQQPREEIEMEVFENQSESTSKDSPRPRPLLAWPMQYSLDELLVKLVPSLGVSTGFFAILVLAVDPSRPQLLFSSLPPEYQNLWSFLFLLAVETLCLSIVYFIGCFSNVTQAMVFGKCQTEFKRMILQLRNLEDKFQNSSIRDIDKEIWILRQILEELRELVLFIELFNRCFPFCIFSWKIFSLSISILLNFFSIRYHEEFPFLAGFLGYCGIMIPLMYNIMYAPALPIPRKMEELKREFLLSARKTMSAPNDSFNVNLNKNMLSRAEFKREVKRIQNVGIKVGSFHQMERESTPNFVDFVFRNVVNLLVTIPR